MDLKGAWGTNDKKERRSAIRHAWEKNKTLQKQTSFNWKSGKKTAWDVFYNDRKNCHTKEINPASDDNGNHGIDTNL